MKSNICNLFHVEMKVDKWNSMWSWSVCLYDNFPFWYYTKFTTPQKIAPKITKTYHLQKIKPPFHLTWRLFCIFRWGFPWDSHKLQTSPDITRRSRPRMHRRYGSPPELCIHTKHGWEGRMVQRWLGITPVSCIIMHHMHHMYIDII